MASNTSWKTVTVKHKYGEPLLLFVGMDKGKEKQKEYARRWQERHPERAREVWRAYYYRHRMERIESVKRWRKNNPEKVKAYTQTDSFREYNARKMRNYRAKLKRRVFELLGNKCARCGFDDQRALQIDHVNGGGTKERKRFRNYDAYLKFVLRQVENGSKNYQLLCANCNAIKRWENKEVRLKRA